MDFEVKGRKRGEFFHGHKYGRVRWLVHDPERLKL